MNAPVPIRLINKGYFIQVNSGSMTYLGFTASGRSDLNRRRSAWKADILPLNYGRTFLV